jgi:hypothetical protein
LVCVTVPFWPKIGVPEEKYWVSVPMKPLFKYTFMIMFWLVQKLMPAVPPPEELEEDELEDEEPVFEMVSSSSCFCPAVRVRLFDHVYPVACADHEYVPGDRFVMV